MPWKPWAGWAVGEARAGLGSMEGTEGNVCQMGRQVILSTKLFPGPACQPSFACPCLALWLRPMLFTDSQGTVQISVVFLQLAFSFPHPRIQGSLLSSPCCSHSEVLTIIPYT